MGANIFKNEAKGQNIGSLNTLWEQYTYIPVESIVLPEE
jgi:hypothetical protein